MDIDAHELERAVKELRVLARTGASVGALLELAKTTVAARSSPVRAALAFYRAFDIPLFVATSLGSWAGFSETNQGVSAEDLESEFGDILRSSIR